MKLLIHLISAVFAWASWGGSTILRSRSGTVDHIGAAQRKAFWTAPVPRRFFNPWGRESARGLAQSKTSGVRGGSWGQDTNVVFFGDFEVASLQNPPANWAMWGAEEFKIAANYTRDTDQPHGGQACL